MARRTNENPNGENWIKRETAKKFKSDAKTAALKREEWEKGKEQITVKHPNAPRAVIIKYK